MTLARVDESLAVERSGAERSRRLVDSKAKPAGGRAKRSEGRSGAEWSGAKAEAERSEAGRLRWTRVIEAEINF